MSFGMKNVAKTFQQFMDQVLQGLQICYVYIDDLLIAIVLTQRNTNSNCTWCRVVEWPQNPHQPTEMCVEVKYLQFLGHDVDHTGINPREEKVQAICDFPQPTTQNKLRLFLGLINFCHHFVPNCAHILQPLNTLQENIQRVSFGMMTQAFTTIKELLTNVT